MGMGGGGELANRWRSLTLGDGEAGAFCMFCARAPSLGEDALLCLKAFFSLAGIRKGSTSNC